MARRRRSGFQVADESGAEERYDPSSATFVYSARTVRSVAETRRVPQARLPLQSAAGDGPSPLKLRRL